MKLAPPAAGIWDTLNRRVLWLAKPAGAVALTVWLLSPSTADTLEIGPMLLLGFLLGALYGAIFFMADFRRLFFSTPLLDPTRRNHVPTTYLLGRLLLPRSAPPESK